MPRGARLHARRWLARRDSERIRRELAVLASGSGPIIAGPWLGEVGFELLYWAPFLNWFVEAHAVDPTRIVVISRGGVAAWYPEGIRYADVLDAVQPETYKTQHDQRVRALGEQKQTHVSTFELDLVKTIAAQSGASNAPVLHPSQMYRALRPFWWKHFDTDWVHRHVRYRRLTPSPTDLLPAQSEGYTAVKFYFNECFPASDRNIAGLRTIVAELAAQGPVVTLASGLDLDEHRAFLVAGQGVTALPRVAPSRNLELQSTVVAHARRFVGTYGGFAYLAPFFGVPSVGYFSDASGFSASHLRMARSAFAAIGTDKNFEVRPMAGSDGASLAASPQGS